MQSRNLEKVLPGKTAKSVAALATAKRTRCSGDWPRPACAFGRSLHQVLADEALSAEALFDRRLAGGLGEEGSEGAANTGFGSHGTRDWAAVVPHQHATRLFHDFSGGAQPLDSGERDAQRLIEASGRVQLCFAGQSPTSLLEDVRELRRRQPRSKLAHQRRQHHLVGAGRHILAARRRLLHVSRLARPVSDHCARPAHQPFGLQLTELDVHGVASDAQGFAERVHGQRLPPQQVEQVSLHHCQVASRTLDNNDNVNRHLLSVGRKVVTVVSTVEVHGDHRQQVAEDNMIDQEVLDSETKADRFPFSSKGDITLAVRNANYTLGPVMLYLTMKPGRRYSGASLGLKITAKADTKNRNTSAPANLNPSKSASSATCQR